MDKKVFLENIKEKFTAIKDKIISFINENKKLSIIIAGLLALMVICIILLIVLFSNKNKNTEKHYEEKLQLTQELVVPNGPELPRDYTISRETKESWSEEEGENWFTVPSDKEIEGLSKANNNIIDDLLGAAP